MISFRTLGTTDLRRDGKEISTVLAQPKRLALLAYLASARPRGFHSRDSVLALFWPDADAERARNSLRQALHQLRRSLGDDALPSRGDREVGVDGAVLECDAVAFDVAVEEQRWEDALRLYAGDFLPGLFVQDAPEVERWLDDERARRRRDAAAAAWRLVERTEQERGPAAAEGWARQAVALDPSDEGGIRRLLALLGRSGDVAGAVAAYDDFARRLRQDFELEPSRETAALVEELRRGGRSGSEPAGAEPARVEPGAGHIVAATIIPAVTNAAMIATRAAASTAPVDRPDSSDSASSVEPPAAPRRRARTGVLAACAALLLALAAVGVWLTRGRDAGAAESGGTPTIAVLPFVNMSSDPENEFFSDGISEELLNLLAQVPGLQVAARTSSFTFKGKNLPVDSIGRALRVRHVLEGSVRQSGDRVRITAQLIDASTGYHIWSGTFDERVEDVFAVQDSIGKVIVETLRPRLAGGSPSSPAQRREPSDPEAHVAVLKGWRAFRGNTKDAWEAAALHFQEAMRRDSTYGAAYAGLANVRHWQAGFRHLPPDAAYAEAEILARRALALDSTRADAYLVLGRIADLRDRQPDSALAHYARAIALAPSDPRPYGRRAPLLVRLGRGDEALASAQRAVELDPASPSVYADLAVTYNALNRFPEQERALRQALALDPGHPILLGNLATLMIYLGRFAEADSAILEARRRVPNEPDMIGRHSYVSARLGRTDRARALLDSAEAAGLGPISLATTYLVLGDRERALALVERSVRSGDDGAVTILEEGILEPLKTDPRMQRLMDEVRGRKDQPKR